MGDKKSYDIRAIFEQMELDLISSMHRAFYFHQIDQSKEGFEWEQWQLTKLREIEKYRKRNKKIINSYNAPIQEAIDRELKGNFQKGQNRVAKLIDKIKSFFGLNKVKPEINMPSDIAEKLNTRQYIAKLLNRPIKPNPEENFFGVNDKKLEALQQTVTKDLKNANAAALRKMDDVYRQTIYKSHVYLQSGAKTLNQAIDMSTKEFLKQGVNCIKYKNGNRVNIASYAEMALRTASQRATFLGEGKKRDEWGLHLVVVSAHANTCKMCEPWQGKILIDDVFSHGTKVDGDYPLLSEAIKAGLLHPNCRHTLATYFPGITQLPTIPDGGKAIKTYEAEQKQRAYERAIRKQKRIVEGSCDENNKARAETEVKALQKRLREHIGNHRELRRDYEREKPKTPYESIRNYKLNNVVTIDGIKIESPSEHLKERAKERSVSEKNILDALKNPLKIGNIKVDKKGRKSKTYIGEKATVAINPDTGVTITTYPTSSNRARRLKDENKTE